MPVEIAAVIMEPVMVNGGAVVPEPGYLDGVRDLCRAKGALFICDEVITGFRVGLRGAQGQLGVTADLAIYAKAVAAGFPLAMVAGRRDVMDTLLDKGVMHGGTYNGNVQSMAAALAALDELERDDGAVYRDLERRGTRLMQGLAATGRQAPACRCACRGCRRSSRSSSPPARHRATTARPIACDRDRCARLPSRAAGGGHPHQPGRQVVPVDGA